MIILVSLITIIEGLPIFPSKPFQLKEVEWTQCEYPHKPYTLVSNQTSFQYYQLDNIPMCLKNTEFDIHQNNYEQFYYIFVFAKPIVKELNISIDGLVYQVDIVKLINPCQIVILHTHEYLEGKQYPISITGKDNQFLQFYINFTNEILSPFKDRIIYHNILDLNQNLIPNIDKINPELMSLETNILKQKYILTQFKFKLGELEQLFCHFNILEQENLLIHSQKDSIELISQFEINKSNIIENISFILKIRKSVEITQIYGGSFSYKPKFDLLIQTDGHNNFIQAFVNASDEKMNLLSEMQIQSSTLNSTLIIELKPQYVECPSNQIITLTHLQISNKNYVQWSQIYQQNFYNCKIQIQHSFTDEGEYQVKLSAKMQIENWTFYLHNQGMFQLYYIPLTEYNLGMVLVVYFGTIIFFISIFIIVLKKCDMIIYNKWDTAYFRSIFEENYHQEQQQ